MEGVEVDRLGQVEEESGIEAALGIDRGAETAERDGGKGADDVDLFEQIDSGFTGYGDVAEQEIEFVACGEGDGGRDGGGGGDGVALAFEEPGDDGSGIVMVFNEEDAEGAFRGEGGGVGAWLFGLRAVAHVANVGFDIDGERSLGLADEFEEFVDEARFDLGVSPNDLHVAAKILGQADIAFQDAGESEDGGEGGTELVAEKVDEAIFGAVGGFGVVFGGVEFAFAAVALDGHGGELGGGFENGKVRRINSSRLPMIDCKGSQHMTAAGTNRLGHARSQAKRGGDLLPLAPGGIVLNVGGDNALAGEGGCSAGSLPGPNLKSFDSVVVFFGEVGCHLHVEPLAVVADGHNGAEAAGEQPFNHDGECVESGVEFHSGGDALKDGSFSGEERLGASAFGDIVGDAGDAEDVAVVVKSVSAAGGDPADGAIGPDDAKFDGEDGTIGAGVEDHAGEHFRIVGVDALEAGFHGAIEFSGGHSPHTFEEAGPVKAFEEEVPFPDAHARAVDGVLEFALADFGFVLGFFEFGDITEAVEDAVGGSSVEDTRDGEKDGESFTVFAIKDEFKIECAAAHGGFECGGDDGVLFRGPEGVGGFGADEFFARESAQFAKGGVDLADSFPVGLDDGIVHGGHDGLEEGAFGCERGGEHFFEPPPELEDNGRTDGE